MTRAVTAPDLSGIVADFRQRIERIERRLGADEGMFDEEIVFSHAGIPEVTTKSPPYLMRNSQRLSVVVFGVGTPGTTDSVVTLYRAGVSIGSVTLGAGGTFTKAPFDLVFSRDTDYAQVAATTLGSGARDWTVQLRFMVV